MESGGQTLGLREEGYGLHPSLREGAGAWAPGSEGEAGLCSRLLSLREESWV